MVVMGSCTCLMPYAPSLLGMYVISFVSGIVSGALDTGALVSVQYGTVTTMPVLSDTYYMLRIPGKSLGDISGFSVFFPKKYLLDKERHMKRSSFYSSTLNSSVRYYRYFTYRYLPTGTKFTTRGLVT